MAEGAFGTIWKGSFRRSNGLNYEIAIKTIKVDEDTSREKDKELIDLLKVIDQSNLSFVKESDLNAFQTSKVRFNLCIYF